MTQALQKKFVKSLKKVAKDLGLDEADVTKPQFMKHDESGLSEWDLRKSGGYNSLKNMYFPPSEVDLDVKYGSKMIKSYNNKLEKQYGESLFFERELLNGLKEHLKDSPIKLHPPTKLPVSKTKTKRSIVAAISDTHFGANISKEELHGINEFNWTVAARRMALYMDQIVSYKPAYRKDTDVVIQLNGDIIAGQIHNQEWFVDLLATQFSGTVHLLTQAISYVAQHFPKVTVVCTPGNHGRNVGKADRGRATTHKWDSYENMIYAALRDILTAKHKNVSFVIPESPFAIYKVQGHNICQTHGDTVINVGNPGKSLNMDGINNQINQMNASDLVKVNEKIAVTCVGHVHVATAQILNNGSVLIINGCLSGTDPFAQSIGIHSNNPTQVLFEATEKHAVGDIRMIQVKEADKDARYDKIIEPFKAKM